MGKYEFEHDAGANYDRGYLIPWMKNIANELAEANRLKRLELMYGQLSQVVGLDNDLVDKA